jgi:glutathione peroxidase-family protein
MAMAQGETKNYIYLIVNASTQVKYKQQYNRLDNLPATARQPPHTAVGPQKFLGGAYR